MDAGLRTKFFLKITDHSVTSQATFGLLGGRRVSMQRTTKRHNLPGTGLPFFGKTSMGYNTTLDNHPGKDGEKTLCDTDHRLPLGPCERAPSSRWQPSFQLAQPSLVQRTENSANAPNHTNQTVTDTTNFPINVHPIEQLKTDRHLDGHCG